MGTRSRIGVMEGNVCKSIYCHWDGYLDHNGKILLEHFDTDKAKQLVSLGDMSSLRPDIGVEHPFSRFETQISDEEWEKKFGNMCTFYGRDRGEQNTEYQEDTDFVSFLERVDNCTAEYYYIMKDGVWYCGDSYDHSPISGKLVPLADAIENQEKEDSYNGI